MANIIEVKVKDGEDIVVALTNYARSYGIDLGFYTGGKGKLRDAEVLAQLDKGHLNNLHFRDATGIVAVGGQIKRTGANWENQMNISLAKGGAGTTVNGRLIRGKADGEVTITFRNVNMKKIIEA